MARLWCGGALVALGVAMQSARALAAQEIIVGDVRVQALSPTLVRIEQKGPLGFEDRNTLTVVNRAWAEVPLKSGQVDGSTRVSSSGFQVEIPAGARDLIGIKLRGPAGELLHTITRQDLSFGFLPSPGAMPKVWVLPDAPRLVPPAWGATPAPASNVENPETSGWETKNQAQDLYLFIRASGGYAGFRQEFLKLTGPIPMPPLFTFGLWFSRYWPYSEEESLALMDEFRARGFPFDVMVSDTDWRVGKSTGYAVNQKLFPDMARYIARAHEKNVRVMFNDHPEPQSPGALDPQELTYRAQGLDSLLNIGADVWWYDKNWNKTLKAPAGLKHEFWGMVVYHDITLRKRPDRRPLIMSNVDGIWNGQSVGPSHPAAHRYPIWWTGDTLAFWEVLRSGIENGVNSGIDRMMPYVNEDLGGHVLEQMPDQFIRWFQFGALSPLPRPHTYPKTVHYPWAYGAEAEKICREYTQLRYRLLPTIYTAARRAYDDGTPLLRRCDLQWPQYPEAASGLQYLFGDDLLVAPQCYSGLDPIPSAFLKTPEGQPGLKAEYFDHEKLEGTPKLVRTEDRVHYFFQTRPDEVPKNNVAVRWTGTLGPVEKPTEYVFGLSSKDVAKLWIGDTGLISREKTLRTRHEITLSTGRIRLEAGKIYPLKVEFFQKTGGECNLFFGPADKVDDPTHQSRSLWLPPGRWQDAWTGETVVGPKTIGVTSDLEHTPIYVREGGLIVTTPLRMHTGTPVWENLVVEAFVSPEAGTTRREVYEDDGLSNDYAKGKFSRTNLVLKTEDGKTTLRIEPAAGSLLPAGFKRDWTLRLHLPAGQPAASLTVNGKKIQPGSGAGKGIGAVRLQPVGARVFPLLGAGAAPGMKSGEVVEITVADYPADRALTVACGPMTPVQK